MICFVETRHLSEKSARTNPTNNYLTTATIETEKEMTEIFNSNYIQTMIKRLGNLKWKAF